MGTQKSQKGVERKGRKSGSGFRIRQALKYILRSVLYFMVGIISSWDVALAIRHLS